MECLQAAAGYTLATLITDIGSMVTGAVSWIGSYVGAVTSNPLILFSFYFSLFCLVVLPFIPAVLLILTA